MSETVRGVYRNGVIEPAEPLKIADGTEVYVTVQRQRSREELLELLLKLKKRAWWILMLKVGENLHNNLSRSKSKEAQSLTPLLKVEGRDKVSS
ncbi:antitoxin family protein [candidate division KSB1 bacterium]|nr:antitoxin family protein [candidate division KSB1 bacterium]